MSAENSNRYQVLLSRRDVYRATGRIAKNITLAAVGAGIAYKGAEEWLQLESLRLRDSKDANHGAQATSTIITAAGALLLLNSSHNIGYALGDAMVAQAELTAARTFEMTQLDEEILTEQEDRTQVRPPQQG